jgi:Carboxylesterase family
MGHTINIRSVEFISIFNALDHVYTMDQVQFSRQLIEQWSNFIKFGQPTSSIIGDRWSPMTQMSTASFMHLQANRSEMKRFNIPSTVKFWLNQCTMTKVNVRQSQSQATMNLFSWTILVFFQFSIETLRRMN